MTRRPRIEFVSAVYHVISRGVHGEAIYQDEEDRQGFLMVVSRKWISQRLGMGDVSGVKRAASLVNANDDISLLKLKKEFHEFPDCPRLRLFFCLLELSICAIRSAFCIIADRMENQV